MPDVETETLTIKELAEYCNCSKIPVRKQLDRLDVPVTYKTQHGKQVTAYKLTKLQLSSIRENINNNKGIGNLPNNITSNADTVTNYQKQNINVAENPAVKVNSDDMTYKNLLDKYIEYREMYAIANNSLKLLEDRQAGTMAQAQQLQAEKESLIKENATVTAQLNEEKNKSGLYKKCLIATGFVIVILTLLILTALVIRY